MNEREQDSPRSRKWMANSRTPKISHILSSFWSEDGQNVERVLARAINMTLARAIYLSAQKEHPDRRIILRHLSSIVDQIS